MLVKWTKLAKFIHMKEVNIHEAKTHLSKLLQLVAEGEEVLISKAGRPVAKLVPCANAKRSRKPGALSGKIHIASDFDDPLPPEILKAFLGEP